MTVLSVRDLGKSFRSYRSEWQRFGRWFGLPFQPAEEHWVLRHLSFDVEPGEAVGIVGENGAGKSTLLKMITGTLQPTEGGIAIHGQISAILELGMGFNPELTGRQNARHAAGLMGRAPEQVDAAIPEIEAFAEIGDYFDEPVRTYSSGMQMRVAFAVATAFRPDVLIVDEALSVGDSYFQAKCFKRIKEFRNQGTTLLLVTHSAGDVVKHCERAIMLKHGAIAIDGPSRVVTNRYLDELFGKKGTASGASALLSDSLSETSMLAETSDQFHTRPGYHADEHRWGQGGAAILDFLVVAEGQQYPSRVEGNSQTDFYFKVRFDADIESIVPGFLIKTIEGIFLYGTNSFVSSRGQERISVSAGDTRIFRFSLPLALNEGDYLISFGVSSGDPLHTLTPLDRRYDSVLIHVSRAVQFWGIVDLQASFHCIDSTTEAVAT